MTDDERLARLKERLDEGFVRRDLPLQALIHRSYAHERSSDSPDNERLEFLGDAVIDLAVSQRLMERHPDLSEGELSKRRAAVVNEASLAEVARALGLGELLLLGRGEEQTGGREKPSVLADALEAVVAALYLEHGMPAALRLVDRRFSSVLDGAAAGTWGADYKTRVQEIAQGRRLGHPRYRVAQQSGPDHATLFEVELSIQGAVVGTGTGASKKEAEQAAARTGLAAIEALPTPPTPAGTPSSNAK